GDALHVLGCAAGYNLRWLLRWIAFLRAWLQVVRARSSTPSSTPPCQSSCRPDRILQWGDNARLKWHDTVNSSRTKRWRGCCRR
ncbi:hypothetical protein, partial [Xanthomonas oryzae]|uniref:hypothetical protein n=1 Tax=Xanthomonas oryzae TaxID=347 RepID=UPI0012B4142E